MDLGFQLQLYSNTNKVSKSLKLNWNESMVKKEKTCSAKVVKVSNKCPFYLAVKLLSNIFGVVSPVQRVGHVTWDQLQEFLTQMSSHIFFCSFDTALAAGLSTSSLRPREW